MKNRSPSLVKQAISLFKAKSMEARSKASAVRTRLIIFKLLRDKNALIGVFPCEKNIELSFEEQGASRHDETIAWRGDGDDEAVERGGEFEPEDEVDRAADVFIRKFREEMMIQRRESFEMYEEMLARGV